LPDVRRADARSAQIGGPDGISQLFQVNSYSGEPFAPIAARNLLSKHRCRSALGDEAQKSGPKMPLVGFALPLARAGEGLAGATSGPHGAVGGPAGESESKGPAGNPAEKVALGVSFNVGSLHIADVALVYVAGGQFARCHEVAKPLRGERVVLVIVRPAHARTAFLVPGFRVGFAIIVCPPLAAW
jgi:hypothetical protein